MNSSHRVGRFALVAMLAVFALSIFAISASAATISPLNTKFEGKGTSVRWEGGGASWNCSSMAVAGTTGATKVNSLQMTPTLSGCSMAIGTGELAVNYTNTCTGGAVPWTVALTESTQGSLTSNCVQKITIPAAECTASIPAQTIPNAVRWFSGTSYLEIKPNLTFKNVLAKSPGCGLFGFKPTELRFSSEIVIKGIHTE